MPNMDWNMSVARPSGKPELQVILGYVKLREWNLESQAADRMAIVYLHDPRDKTRPTVEQLQQFYGLTKAQAGEAVDATFEAVTETLKSGDEVRIIGFGNFTVSARAATEGRNPRTGETIQIPASKTPKFNAGKGLKDAVNA